MPGLTLVARETTNLGCNCNRSRAGDQMCHQESKVHLSSEEAIAAEESLSVYCKPVELYNILQRRALRNPSFLQRCLHYKIEAKQKKRMQMTISLSGIVNAGAQAQDVLPLYVLLARAVPDNMVEKHSVAYRLSRACVLTAFSESGRERSQATFIMPELNKLLAEAKSGSLSVLLVTFGETRVSSGENNLLKDHSDLASIPYVQVNEVGNFRINFLNAWTVENRWIEAFGSKFGQKESPGILVVDKDCLRML